jgi:hypothetical protein
LEIVQRRAAMFVSNRQRNTLIVDDMLQNLNWHCLQDRRKDARHVMISGITFIR